MFRLHRPSVCAEKAFDLLLPLLYCWVEIFTNSKEFIDMKLPTLRLPFFSKKIPPKTPKLSFMDKLKGVAQQRLQQKDISQLIKSGQLMEGLNIPPLHTSHPLRSIAKKLKNDVYKIESSSIKVRIDFGFYSI